MQLKTRIAMISEHASPMALLGGEDAGGQNVYVDELSNALAADGYEIDVFTRRDSADSAEINPWRRGVRVINLTAGPTSSVKKDLLWPFMPELRDSFLRFTKSQGLQYSLIHAHFWMSGWVACELKRALNIPVVETFHTLGVIKRMHQGSADTSPKQRFSIERRVITEADRIVATCPSEREDLIDHYGAQEQNISIIPCGVNTSLFFPVDRIEARQRLGIDPSASVVLYVGRVLPRKGIDNIIAALTLLANTSDLPIQLVVVGGENEVPFVGEDSELRRLESLTRTLGIRELVTFTGKRSQQVLRFYYSAADVCVTTPWYESFGMVPLESMACGMPVIASAVGGHTHTVLDGVTGFLVPPRDANALAEKLEFFLARPALRDELSAKAIKRIARFFTWARVAGRVSDLYTSLISTHGSQQPTEPTPFIAGPTGFEPDLPASQSPV